MTLSRLFAVALALVLVAGAATAQTTLDQMSAEMARAYAEDLQRELALRGYDPGPVDGVTGARTAAAIRAYQRDVGLPVDGIATRELLEYMLFNVAGATSGPEPVPGLDPTFVRSIQIELVERGYYHGEIDGIAGPATRSGIERFQRDAGLVVNGAIDRRLLDELRNQPATVRATGA